jgi:hypothetical protein
MVSAQMRAKIFVLASPAIRRPEALAAVAAISISLWYAARSLALAIGLREPIPYFDQWIFIANDYFRWLDGTYRWLDLFAIHMEHRIMTTRLVLIADIVAFDMKGVLPLVVTYASLAASAAIIAALCSEGSKAAACTFLFSLGLAWATCQWANLGIAFEVQIPLVHLFALGALAALAMSLQTSSWRWLALAAAADFLAVFSLGSGPFLIAPMTLLAVWMRRLDRRFYALAAFHAALTAAYFGMSMAEIPYDFAVLKSVELFFRVLGLPLAAHPVLAGAVGIFWFTLVAGVLSYRSATGAEVDRAAATLAAVAAFAIIEGAVVGYTRVRFGAAPRYATVALFFWGGTLGSTWRLVGWRLRVPVLAAAVLLTVMANSPVNESYLAQLGGTYGRREAGCGERRSQSELPRAHLPRSADMAARCDQTDSGAPPGAVCAMKRGC